MSSDAGKLYADLPLPIGYQGELIASGLRSEGWESLAYSELTREITGKLERTDKKGDIAFEYDYRIKCRWALIEDNEDLTRIFVEIKDREKQSQKYDCERLCSDLLETIQEAGQRAEEYIKTQEKSVRFGSDRWATKEDLNKNKLIKAPEKIDDNSIILGPHASDENNQRLVIPEKQACRHALVCGPTGCGKSSSVFIPNIVERSNYSAILTEATSGDEPPDLYTKTSGHRLNNGHKVYYFNPDDSASVRINPIEHVKSVSQALDIASLIMLNTQGKFKAGGDKFWKDAEQHLLTALIMHVAPEGGHLGDVRALIRKGPDKLGKVLSDSSIETAQEEYQAFLDIGTENIQKGVMIGLLQRLNIWVDPKILALTEKTDLDFDRLKNELFSFYLAVPASKERLKPVASLVLNYLLEYLEHNELKHKVNLFLDEFTNFGHIPSLPGKMGIIRHKEIPVMLGCQDFVQIRIEYGDDPTKAIFNNIGTKIMFRSNDLMTAKNISESLGQETVTDRKLDTACNVQQEEFGRPLMRPSEVMTLNEELSIVFNPITHPIKLKRFGWQDYVSFTENDPHKHDPVEVDDRLQKECKKEKTNLKWQKETKEDEIEKEAENYKAEVKTEDKDKKKEKEPPKEGPEKQTEYNFELPL